MKKVRLAIIGVGNMGSCHVRSVMSMPNAELAAVCDIDRERADKWAEYAKCRAFYSTDELFAANCVDGVIVAVPHYDHPDITIEAFRHNLHVLCEKPVAVTKSEGERMAAEHAKHPELIFSLMFLQRSTPCNSKFHDLIKRNELGDILRIQWTITTWFRTQSYYDSGDWRATWAGEGGGVLLNQCPHQLDLFQWFFGLPEKVRSFVHIAKHHDIEVEDEVTSYMEFANGATGVFITSTGEFPGTNRLEVAGTRGRLVCEENMIKFKRTEDAVDTVRSSSPDIFHKIPTWDITIPLPETGGGTHKYVIENFVNAILDPTVKLIAPGEEGIRSVELGNAMLYSGLTGNEVRLPMDTAAFDAKLAELRKTSRYVKKNIKSGNADMKKGRLPRQ